MASIAPVRHSHCSYCGAAFKPHAPWPRQCRRCRQTSFLNPIPVVIVLLPVTTAHATGILTVRRSIAPHAGKLALPGGYIDYGESWQGAGAREMAEEANVFIDPAALQPIEVFSPTDGTLIIAAAAPPHPLASLPPFAPSPETSAREILLAPKFDPDAMAFPLHAHLITRYFAAEPLGYRIQADQPPTFHP